MTTASADKPPAGSEAPAHSDDRCTFAPDHAGPGGSPGHPGFRHDDLYASRPPWDIGHSQPAFKALAEQGVLRGRVLDVGCGTGEHALMCKSFDLI